jgi:hypothetical protein
MIKEAIDIWLGKLPIPSKVEEIAYKQIEGTNIILSKNYKGEFGLIITDTTSIPKNFKLKNFDFSYIEKLETKYGARFKRCQQMFAHSNINTDYLIKVLFGILEDEQKPYSSNTLIKVLKELNSLFNPEEQKRNEVIGVWGELFMINKLIDWGADKIKIENIINSWEADGGRMKIDFRFLHAKIALEVKTTTEVQRIHHFSGLEQFTIPYGFDNLYFASLRVLPDGAGESCDEIVIKIKNNIADKSLVNIFEERLLVRGRSLCYDDYHRFTPRDENAFSLYNAKSIKTPSIHDGIIEVNWKQNLDLELQIENTKVGEIFKSIKGE